MDHVGTYDVDLSWTGVPMPHQQFVNLYRILYHEQNINSVEPELFDIFILAQDINHIDSVSKSRIISLRPDTPYQIWLEAYLRNGKVVTSNVLDITTRQGHPNKGMCILHICTPSAGQLISNINEKIYYYTYTFCNCLLIYWLFGYNVGKIQLVPIIIGIPIRFCPN